MNKFATIQIAATFNKVTYYTVKFEDETYSEFEKFIINHQKSETIRNEFQALLALIKRLGNEEGAQSRYFTRNENKAEALPPQWRTLQSHERKLYVKQVHNLRLYCMRITDEIVFLFNGGVKTPGPITAQQCNVVRKYFKMANKLAVVIEQAIIEKELKLNGTQLEFEEDFELIM